LENTSHIKTNLTMLTDFYELTMANGYFTNGYRDTIAYFDMFFREIPDNGGYAIMAGVQQIVEYLEHLEFTPEDIEYLRSCKIFNEEFLQYLQNFRFSCDVWAVKECRFPRRADYHCAWSGHSGPVCRNYDFADY
jgi:nicotinate phosphoribosyltransferase